MCRSGLRLKVTLHSKSGFLNRAAPLSAALQALALLAQPNVLHSELNSEDIVRINTENINTVIFFSKHLDLDDVLP